MTARRVCATCLWKSPRGRCQRAMSHSYARIVSYSHSCSHWDAKTGGKGMIGKSKAAEPMPDFDRIEIRSGERGLCNVVKRGRDNGLVLIGTALTPVSAFKRAREYADLYKLPVVNAMGR